MSSYHCYCQVDVQENYMLCCDVCKKYFHTGCLKSGRPTSLLGDTFFKFICQHCSPTGEEVCLRLKLQWTQVLLLALYNLQFEGGGKQGYFRWREHVCAFIDRHWDTFFGNKKKTNTWHGTVAGTLSGGCPHFFKSGTVDLGETGWWALNVSKIPAAQEFENQSVAKLNRKQKQPALFTDMSMPVEGLRHRSHKSAIVAAMELKEKRSTMQEVVRKRSQPKTSTTIKSELISTEMIEEPNCSSKNSAFELCLPSSTVNMKRDASGDIDDKTNDECLELDFEIAQEAEEIRLGILDLEESSRFSPGSPQINELLSTLDAEAHSGNSKYAEGPGIRNDKKHIRDDENDILWNSLASGASLDLECDDDFEEDTIESRLRTRDDEEESSSSGIDNSSDEDYRNVLRRNTRSKRALKRFSKEKLAWTKKKFKASKSVSWKWNGNVLQRGKRSSAFELFSKYFPDDFFETVAHFTNQHAIRKNGISVNATFCEMRYLFAIHVLMGCLKFPRIRMSWSMATKIPLISELMTANRFSLLKNHLHLVETDMPDASNRLWKVQPIIDAVLNRCKEMGWEENLAIDEQIIPFKGQTSIKHFSRRRKNKPWGIKVFFLHGKSGLVHNFLVYQGSTTSLDLQMMKEFGLGPSVVLKLAEIIPVDMNFKLFFDNYFTTIPLLKKLVDSGILAAGTVQKSRLEGCPLSSEKQMTKKRRGTSEEFVKDKDDDIVVTAWMDRRVEMLASNFVGIGAQDKLLCWDKATRSNITVSRPEVVQKYNRAMSGADTFEALIASYCMPKHTRNWMLRVMFYFVDVAITNSWLEYKREAVVSSTNTNEQFDLLDFRLNLANALASVNTGLTLKRPQNLNEHLQLNIPGRISRKRKRPLNDSRFDNYAHFPTLISRVSQRCAYCSSGKSRIMCEKCKMFLCFNRARNCYKAFHTRSLSKV